MIWRMFRIWFRFLWLQIWGSALPSSARRDIKGQQIGQETESMRQRDLRAKEEMALRQTQHEWEVQKWEEEQKQEREEWGLTSKSMDQMVREYNRAYGESVTEEERRYQEIEGIADATTGQRAADIRADYSEQQSNAMQRLARLGMANTTVAPTLAMGYQREQQSALNRLADEMQQTQIGVRERRELRQPDQGLLTSTSQQLGQGGTAARAAAPMSGMRMY